MITNNVYKVQRKKIPYTNCNTSTTVATACISTKQSKFMLSHSHTKQKHTVTLVNYENCTESHQFVDK